MFENRSQQSKTEVNARKERSQNSSSEQTCFLLKKTVESQYSSSSLKNQFNGTCSGHIGNFLNIPYLKIKLDKKIAYCNHRTHLESRSFFVFEVTLRLHTSWMCEGRLSRLSSWGRGRSSELLDTKLYSPPSTPPPPPFSISEHQNKRIRERLVWWIFISFWPWNTT